MMKHIKILHILHDEKHIDDLIELFNSSTSINTYVTIEDELPFKLIKYHASEVQVIERDKILSFIKEGGYQLVAFHSLTRDKYELVMQIPKEIKVLWSEWGYDIYEPWLDMPPVCPIEIYKPLTKQMLLPKSLLFDRIIRKIIKIIQYKRYRDIQIERQRILQSELKLQQRLLKRIDYMATVLPYEYDLLSHLESFSATYFPFQYATKKNSCVDPIYDNANKILLGNSATATNNHLDVINILRERKIWNECVLPCSYGKADYLEKLKHSVANIPKMRFLDTFMPLAEYTNLLKSCRVGVFGHVRQQSIGSILLCMLQGSKVFLWKDSVAYKYFKNAGCFIYTIEDDLTVENIEKLLSKNEREINQKIVIEQFSYPYVIERLNKYLSTL